MPTQIKDVKKFFERIAVLEEKINKLEGWQKWEMMLLSGIILLLFKVVLSR